MEDVLKPKFRQGFDFFGFFGDFDCEFVVGSGFKEVYSMFMYILRTVEFAFKTSSSLGRLSRKTIIVVSATRRTQFSTVRWKEDKV